MLAIFIAFFIECYKGKLFKYLLIKRKGFKNLLIDNVHKHSKFERNFLSLNFFPPLIKHNGLFKFIKYAL